jgi:phosphatidyl-myo-inositol dimannoside synthase
MSGPILLVTPDFPPAQGGIQLLAHRLASNLDGDVRVVTFGGPGAEEFDSRSDLAVERIGWRDGQRHRLKVGRLNAAALGIGIRSGPMAVISGHAVTAPAAVAISTLTRTPLIQYLHADEARHRPRLVAFAVRRAGAVVAVSGHARDTAVAAGADPARVRVVLPGVDQPAEVPAEPASQLTVITVARLSDRYKGHDTMLRALPLVRERIPGVRWMVVGDGPLRGELEAEAEGSGLSEAVTFAGSVTDEDRDRLLSSAHVFAMPSRLPAEGVGGEGFGIVYLEAAAHGLPVVAGDVAGARDAVIGGQTGLLVDAEDPRAVAGALASLLGDPERARAMGEAGRARARALTWRRHAEAVQSLAEELAAGR